MRFRLRNLLMYAIVIIGVALFATPSVYAASDLTTSEKCISMIKEFEGFRKMAYYDYSQWSIGYGTACEKEEYPEGVTLEEADRLLREHVATLEDKLNKFAKSNKLDFTQNQFDALISFSYNVGISWANSKSQLITSSIIKQATGNDMIFAMSRWCIVTDKGVKKVSTALVNRRLIEANMYLNGEYVNSVPSNYRYIIFEDNTDVCVNDTRVQAFDNTVTDVIRAEPSKSGYVFLGWYTQATGGQWITHVGPDTKMDRLFAHWQQGTEDASGVAADYVRYGTGGNIYGYPSFTSTVVGTLGTGESAVVTADYVDANGIKWGKLATSKWICISETVPQSSTEALEPIEVKVISDLVNVRSGPGTGYAKTGYLSRGTVLLLTEVQQNGKYKWGKCEEGWICLDYTDYDQVLAGTSGDVSGDYEDGTSASGTQGPIVATGTVGKCSSLRIRAGAGTTYDTVGTLYTGDSVELLEIVTVSGLRWGRISSGWICLSYVQLDSGNSSAPTSGKVINCTRLNVRAAPGVSSAKICAIPNGTAVTVYEQATVDGDAWGRIDQGWVHMDYIYLGAGAASSSSGYITGTVYNTDVLRIRKAAGVSNEQMGTLSRGTVVIITETVKVGNTTWGRFERGWISLSYVKLDSSTVPVNAVTKTVNTKSLRIRAGAGTNYECIGSYVAGDQVVITDQTTVKGRLWGRTDKGWICMDYVI